MLISVTKKHIKHGTAGDYNLCPIALAMKAAGLRRPQVGPTDITYLKKGGRKKKHACLTRKLTRFINAFDDGWDDVKPFKFLLMEE